MTACHQRPPETRIPCPSRVTIRDRVPTLLDHLALQFPTAKRTTLRRMVADGRVTVNDRRATRPNQLISDGDRVRVVASERVDPKRLIVPLRIVHEDADLLI